MQLPEARPRLDRCGVGRSGHWPVRAGVLRPLPLRHAAHMAACARRQQQRQEQGEPPQHEDMLATATRRTASIAAAALLLLSPPAPLLPVPAAVAHGGMGGHEAAMQAVGAAARFTCRPVSAEERPGVLGDLHFQHRWVGNAK